MTHDDYIYMIYYYFQSKGIQYDDSYNHIPELPDMIDQLLNINSLMKDQNYYHQQSNQNILRKQI